MQLILMVFYIGTSLNALGGGAHSFAEFNASVRQQLEHPVVQPADPSKYNQ